MYQHYLVVKRQFTFGANKQPKWSNHSKAHWPSVLMWVIFGQEVGWWVERFQHCSDVCGDFCLWAKETICSFEHIFWLLPTWAFEYSVHSTECPPGAEKLRECPVSQISAWVAISASTMLDLQANHQPTEQNIVSNSFLCLHRWITALLYCFIHRFSPNTYAINQCANQLIKAQAQQTIAGFIICCPVCFRAVRIIHVMMVDWAVSSSSLFCRKQLYISRNN